MSDSMATFKNATGAAADIPLLELRVPDGDTVEIPDEFASQFEANPGWVSSKAKTADVAADPEVVASVTGPIPVQAPPGYDPQPFPPAA